MDKLDQLASNGELDNESIYEFLHQIRNITREDLSKWSPPYWLRLQHNDYISFTLTVRMVKCSSMETKLC